MYGISSNEIALNNSTPVTLPSISNTTQTPHDYGIQLNAYYDQKFQRDSTSVMIILFIIINVIGIVVLNYYYRWLEVKCKA